MVDPEKYPGTHAFVNLLNIKSAKKLNEKEADLAWIRGFEIYKRPSVIAHTFDLDHLKSIHKYLFQDIYEWAGETRAFDMLRNGDIFTPYKQIEYYAKKIFDEIAADNYLKGCNASIICQKVARYLGLLNILHPFPEGNGRAQRMFLYHLVSEVGYGLNWKAAPSWMLVLTAQNAHRYNDYKGMEILIADILTHPP